MILNMILRIASLRVLTFQPIVAGWLLTVAAVLLTAIASFVRHSAK
jgi:hypothetical protein